MKAQSWELNYKTTSTLLQNQRESDDSNDAYMKKQMARLGLGFK